MSDLGWTNVLWIAVACFVARFMWGMGKNVADLVRRFLDLPLPFEDAQ